MTSTSKKVTDKKSAISKNKPVEPEVVPQEITPVTEPLLPGYYYRDFAGLTILFNDKDMGNLSKICTDGGNRYAAWERNKFGQAFLAYHKNKYIVAHKNVDDFVTPEPITTGPMLYWGTYGCKKLIIKVANWNCLKIDDKSLDILEEYYEKEAQDREAKIAAERDGLLIVKSSLEAKLEEMDRRQEAMREENRQAHARADEIAKQLLAQNKETHKKLDKTQNTLEETQETLEETQTMVARMDARIQVMGDAVVVPPIDESLWLHFGIMKLNMAANDQRPHWDFKVFCRQTKTAEEAIAEIKGLYPGAEMFEDITPSPNAKNILHLIKENYGPKGKISKLLKYNRNFLSMLPNQDEEDLREAVRLITQQAKEFGVEITDSDTVQAD